MPITTVVIFLLILSLIALTIVLLRKQQLADSAQTRIGQLNHELSELP